MAGGWGQIWLKGLSLLTSVSFGFCFVFVVTISWMGFKTLFQI